MIENDAMWKAFEARDAAVDGRFVVAVRTTGVYCRPSCPSRRPKRENVIFYPDPEAAEKGGFRPCLRCKPEETNSPQLSWVKKICEYIRRDFERRITLEDLEKVTGISSPHLQRVFKRVMGLTPRQYQEVCRIDRLKARLRDGQSVTKAVNNVGYRSTSWIYTNMKAKLGMNPGIYKHAGEGMKIRYRIVDSPLGRLLVARTRHGVCYLGIWDKDDPLETTLRREYSSAEIIKDEGKPDPWTQEVLEYLKGKRQHGLVKSPSR